MTQSYSLKQRLIGNRAFYARVFSILLPVMIQNTVTNVVNLLDNVMVGAVGTLPMSAVAIVNQLMFVFNVCIFGALSGAGIFAAQYAGAKDQRGISHCFRAKAYISALVLALAIALFLCLPEQLIGLYLSADTAPAVAAETMGYAKTYLAIMLVGLLPFTVAQIYGSTLREVGETRLPMLSSVAAIFVNLIFNYLLIFGKLGFPKWGVAGAAVATVLSRFVEVAILIPAAHKKVGQFPFLGLIYRGFSIPRGLVRSILQRGTPLMLNECLWATANAVLIQCYSVRGIHAVAATNITSTVANLFNVLFLSMGNAVAIMVGQTLGANRLSEAKITTSRLLAMGTALSAAVGGVMALAAPYIPLLYNTEADVQRTATLLLWIVAATMPFHAYTHCAYFVIRSGGRTFITFLFDCGFSLAVTVPLAYSLAHFTSLPIVYMFLIVNASDLLKTAVGAFLLKSGIWLKNIVQ